MPHPQWNAEEAVAAASSHPFSAKVWRVHWREVGPADWILSLRTSGRYHRGLDLFPSDLVFPTLYTSLTPEIAIWEMVRRSAARNLVYLRNNVLTELDVDLARVLDLSDPAALGLTQADLTAADQQLCQDLAVRYELHEVILTHGSLGGNHYQRAPAGVGAFAEMERRGPLTRRCEPGRRRGCRHLG